MPDALRRLSGLGVTFYDYTAYRPGLREHSEYLHLTYSLKETHGVEYAREIVAGGLNVAVPFAVGKGSPLPTVWHGMRVVDGDLSDFRPGDDRGVIVGLRAKGRGWKTDESGFFRSVGEGE
jgi:hypothetical protein